MDAGDQIVPLRYPDQGIGRIDRHDPTDAGRIPDRLDVVLRQAEGGGDPDVEQAGLVIIPVD